jgi:pimeloyl-ACP methyl ester carboxylesterase
MAGIGLRLAAVVTLASAALAGMAPPAASAAPDARVVAPARAVATPAATPATSTPAAAAARLAAVKTPKVKWRTCYETYQCAKVKVPLDYDRPRGATVSLALVKRPANQPTRRIGSLFLNPGGPGGSGVDIALAADTFLGTSVLNRFDVVGFDPRGIGGSTEVRCWRTEKARLRALAGFNGLPFPWSRDDLPAYLASASKLSRACSSTGEPLAASMSTAEVASDMELLRRAVGDSQLTYLGFSYGTYLGEVYANMFPDRVRALVLDGVLTPEGWAGTPATADTPVTLRIDSAGGAWKAWQRALELCGEAGPDYCEIADDPQGEFNDVLAALRQGPIAIGDGWGYTYAEFSSDLLSALYYPEGGAEFATWEVSLLHDLLEEPGVGRSALEATLAKGLTRYRARWQHSFGYDNSTETFTSVLCSDSLNPSNPNAWKPAVTRAERLTPMFAPLWGWGSVPCAGDWWNADDEDAWRGTFDHPTANPVLIVGNYWDPATNYDGAVAASEVMPNSFLLSSDSWGHTAYGSSRCVTEQVDRYLVHLELPGRASCTGPQPFTTLLEGGIGVGVSTGAAAPLPDRDGLPAVVPLVPAVAPES